MHGLTLDKILADLDGVTGTKTASASTPAGEKAPAVAAPAVDTKVAAAKDELLAALKRAEAAPAQKTASAKESPKSDLEKVAADLAAADQEALVKEAHFYGAAIADGFMARMGQFEKAAGTLPAGEKTASAADVEKIASEAIRGYVETQNKIKVAAAQEYQKGFQDTMREVTKVASEVFAQGAKDAVAAIAAAKK